MNNIISPPSDNMTTFLAVKLNNKNVIKLIKHFTRILLEKKNLYNLFMWVYTLLSFLQKPLVDDDNCILYSLNKLIKNLIEVGIENYMKYLEIRKNRDNYKDFMVKEDQYFPKCDLIAAKIIYIIISEFFHQRII